MEYPGTKKEGCVKSKNDTAKCPGANLYRKTWRNWFFLVTILLITTMGLVTALPPFLGERIVNPWPWAKTDRLLLTGLSMIVLMFVAYMTQQQRHVMAMHKKLQILQDESAKRLHNYTSRIYALSSVGHLMGAVSDLQSVFDAITGMCTKTLGCDRASLMICDKETKELVVRSVSGTSQDQILNFRQKIGEGIAGWAAEQRTALLLGQPDDAERYPGIAFKHPDIMSAMVVPIITRDELVGVLNVSSQSASVRFSEEDLMALKVLAENAGACIRHNEQAALLRQMIPGLRQESMERDPDQAGTGRNPVLEKSLSDRESRDEI
jgi:putative methionine-R-sulfoxide reductase with GAF domain